ncbi:hypothetical protein FGG08_000112 [Glutinoglossum americanum]|uniref:Ubiquitin-like protease family profile domain-containing protein n=1 Tax=Glutinoglossum americanum TaxID=1670608 RepID=A0A9P8IE18_9PEZI|nr:hypothetical protein FGG08_000112 [Glutinoglossum americanum]
MGLADNGQPTITVLTPQQHSTAQYREILHFSVLLYKMTSQASSPVFTPLSKVWKGAIERLFEGNDPEHEWPVSTYYNLPLTSEVLIQDLKPGQWLSDDIINRYITVLKNTFNQSSTKRFACYNMQFLAQFSMAKGHMPWQKFTDSIDKLNFMSFHLVFVPVRQSGNH